MGAAVTAHRRVVVSNSNLLAGIQIGRKYTVVGQRTGAFKGASSGYIKMLAAYNAVKAPAMERKFVARRQFQEVRFSLNGATNCAI